MTSKSDMTLETRYTTLIKDLGGWAVVVFIVWWLTQRWEVVMDRQLDELSNLTKIITSSQVSILSSIDATTDSIKLNQQKILEELKALIEKK